MEQEKLASVIESILFVSDRPVSLARFLEVFGEEVVSEKEVEATLDKIRERYQIEDFGFELRQAQGGYHFTTKPVNSDWVRKFLQTKPFRLGRSALETMAIIAYRQPITRAEIDQVRGIDSSHLMRTLIERGLVRMAGKAEVPGRPVQYATTERFLQVLGLNSLAELPPLSELEQIQGHTEDPLKPMEEGLEHFIADQHTRAETAITGEDTTGLESIDQMIQSVQKPDREIHASQLHADVARENEAALDGLLQHLRPPRKSRKKVEDEALPETPAEMSTEAAPPLDAIPEVVLPVEDAEPPPPTEILN